MCGSRPIAYCRSSHRSAATSVCFSTRGQPSLPCLVVLPLRREACFPVAGSPLFVARLGLFLRLLLRASLPMTPRGVVWRRCNRPRVRTPAADLAIILLAAVYTANRRHKVPPQLCALTTTTRGHITRIPRAASRTQHLHHACITCITMHHLHQTCITCINPASPASTLHHLHQPCITRIKHQPCITRKKVA